MNDPESSALAGGADRTLTARVSFAPPGTVVICLLTLFTAVVQSIWDGPRISNALGFPPMNTPGNDRIVPGWLTLFTYVFPHGGWWHVLTNTIALWFFGAVVESRIGSLKFVGSYFLAGAVGALCKLLVPPTPEPIAGASLAISGIIGIYCAMGWFARSRPRHQQILVLALEILSIVILALWLTLRIVPAKPDVACSLAYHFIPFLALWVATHLFYAARPVNQVLARFA